MKNIDMQIVVQHSVVLGVNVSFLTDPDCRVDDCVVHAGDWANAKVLVRSATLIADNEVAGLLSPRVFRAESNCYEVFTESLDTDDVMEALCRHDWIDDSPNGVLGPVEKQILEIGRERHRRERHGQAKDDDPL